MSKTIVIKIALTLIKHHVENNPNEFKKTAFELADSLDNLQLSEWIYAQYDATNTFTTQGKDKDE